MMETSRRPARVRATKLQRARTRRGKREAFLEHFAGNCNVAAAAVSAGVSIPTLYRWRRDEPEFAAQWGEAIAMGYQLLEARLVGHALAGDEGATLAGIAGSPSVAVNVDVAMKLMALRRQGATKGFPGRPVKVASREDSLEVLLKRLELIEKRNRAEAERAAQEGRAQAEGATEAAQDGR